MDVSCITTQQIVYWPVDVPSAVRISESKSVSCWLSWAYASGVTKSAQGIDVCEYTYLAGKLRIWECWVLALVLGCADGVLGWGGVSSRFCCWRQSGGGLHVCLSLQHVRGVCVAQFWPRRHPSVSFWQSKAGCLSIAAFTVYAAEIQHQSCSLLVLRGKVTWSDTLFRRLRRAKTSLWPFWPYWRPGAYWTVPAVQDLLALP